MFNLVPDLNPSKVRNSQIVRGIVNIEDHGILKVQCLRLTEGKYKYLCVQHWDNYCLLSGSPKGKGYTEESIETLANLLCNS